MQNPTAALRDDVTDTLQAAIADPDVAARLGRLEKAERWSGFGDFGESSVVGAPSSKKQASPAEESSPAQDEADVATAMERFESARVAVETAAHTYAAATELLAERAAARATARRRYEQLLESVDAAERVLSSADTDYTAAEATVDGAADGLEAAKAALAEAESLVQRLAASTDSSS